MSDANAKVEPCQPFFKIMKSNVLKCIADHLSQLMKEISPELTGKDLSLKSKISYSTLAPILRGDRDFGVTKLIALAEALNTTPNDLLKGVYHEPRATSSMKPAPKAPLYLVSFITSAQLTRCFFYDVETKMSHSRLFNFSLNCTANANNAIEMFNTAILDAYGQEVDFNRIYVYSSVLGYEYLSGRTKLSDLGAREYGLFVMEPDWKLAHSSIFPHQDGIMITINDGYAISYSTHQGEQVEKIQGYVPIAEEAGNLWLGCEAIKHAIGVKEGVEKPTLLSDKILSIVNSDLDVLATRIVDNPHHAYAEMSSVVKELAMHDKKSYSFIHQGFENIWKRVRLLDQKKIGKELPICMAGGLAYLYESFIPKSRLIKTDLANESAYFSYANNILMNRMPK